MKLNSRIHGIIDYGVVIFLWLSPTFFGLPQITALFTYILGGVHLALTILTDFEMGLLKIVPLKVHGWIELIVSIILVGVAFYLDTLEGLIAKYFYLGFALAVFVTYIFSDYKLTEKKNL
jgi:hypothetical protein